MRNALNNTLGLCILALFTLTSTAQAARHHYDEMVPFSENTSPSFSGFYGNLGLGYNMLSSGVDYAAVITPTSGGTQQLITGSSTKGVGAVSGLLKFGYSVRFQPQMYVGLAGFYNVEGTQTLAANTISYNSQEGSINVKETAGSSYGFLLQPGYILNNNKSAIYLNVGMEFTPVTVKTSAGNGDGDIDGTSASTTKSISNVKLGVGYQQHLNLGKFKGANNITWFTELNFNPSSSVNISQVTGADLPPMRDEAMKAKLGNTQLVVGINYYY